MKRIALVVALGAAACGGGRPSTSEPVAVTVDAGAPDAALYDPAELAAIADDLVGTLAQMATIVTARDGDCPAMARELDALFDRAIPVFDRARELAKVPEAARALADEMRRHDLEVAPLTSKISEHLASCHGDLAVITAMQRMPTL